jgi:CRISPR-associated protein Cas5d
MTIWLRTWGDLACFTRPEMKVERVSYPVMTPSAARGLLEAILYRPQFRWRIRRIAVKRPVRFLSFRRNEVKSRLTPRHPEPLCIEEDRTQRNTLALRDVEYVIEASLELTRLANQPRREPPAEEADAAPDSEAKYLAMFQRRAERGQCFAQPCLGCREFPAHFEPADAPAMASAAPAEPDADLGLMLYDVFDLDPGPRWRPGKAEANPRVTLFHAALKSGMLVEHGGFELPAWPAVKAQLGGAQ